MIWNRKSQIERQKELQLTILQLEKLIKRAVDNANNAVVAFDNSFKDLFDTSQETPDELGAMTSTAEFFSASRFIDQNEIILKDIKQIADGKHIQLPRLIRESLKIAQKKNYDAKIMFLAYVMTREKRNPAEGLAEYFVNEINLNKDTKADLLQAVNSLHDFQELFGGHFSVGTSEYVHSKRLDELQSAESNDFDLSKLIRLCEELNNAFQNQNYLSVTMLVRAILDHVPPIFGLKTFVEVANNYGGKSLRKSLQNLQNSSRNIADAHLHEPIRQRESLPNDTQIDFRNDLDVLLGEIVRILK